MNGASSTGVGLRAALVSVSPSCQWSCLQGLAEHPHMSRVLRTC